MPRDIFVVIGETNDVQSYRLWPAAAFTTRDAAYTYAVLAQEEADRFFANTATTHRYLVYCIPLTDDLK